MLLQVIIRQQGPSNERSAASPELRYSGRLRATNLHFEAAMTSVISHHQNCAESTYFDIFCSLYTNGIFNQRYYSSINDELAKNYATNIIHDVQLH